MNVFQERLPENVLRYLRTYLPPLYNGWLFTSPSTVAVWKKCRASCPLITGLEVRSQAPHVKVSSDGQTSTLVVLCHHCVGALERYMNSAISLETLLPSNDTLHEVVLIYHNQTLVDPGHEKSQRRDRKQNIQQDFQEHGGGGGPHD